MVNPPVGIKAYMGLGLARATFAKQPRSTMPANVSPGSGGNSGAGGTSDYGGAEARS
jgi:hypothetical protein